MFRGHSAVRTVRVRTVTIWGAGLLLATLTSALLLRPAADAPDTPASRGGDQPATHACLNPALGLTCGADGWPDPGNVSWPDPAKAPNP